MSEKMSVNGKEFEIIKLLGKGKGGYSYLATDGVKNYVLKQIHHEPCDYYQFGNKIEAEINDYKRLKNIGIRIPEMLDVDVEQDKDEYINAKMTDLSDEWITQAKIKTTKVLEKLDAKIRFAPG